MLASGFHVGWPVHVGQTRNVLDAQTVDDDMHMNVAAAVMPVRVRHNDGLMSREMFFAKILAKLLGEVNVQTVVGCVARIEADDVVMAFHIGVQTVFAIAEIRAIASDGKIIIAAVERCHAVIIARNEPTSSIEGGLHGKLVVLEKEVALGSSVVMIL